MSLRVILTLLLYVMAKRILIFHTSVGLGHKSIAENIGFFLERAGFEVKLADVLQVQKGTLVNITTWLHQLINTKTPYIWKWLYLNKRFTDLTLSSRVRVAARNHSPLKRLLDEFNPDLVITTQTTASAILEYLKINHLYNKPWIIAFSDYHLHRYWLYDHPDHYLVNITEQKEEMIRLGIPAEKISVCGMTVKPLGEVDVPAVKRKLNIPATNKVVLIGSGSLGTGVSIEWLRSLTNQILAQSKDTSIVIVCGKNQALYETLENAHLPDKVHIKGFYKPMAELYAISSIFVTKPGGLTTAESLQRHLPLLITHWLPGQEELNITYLLANNLIIPRPEPASAEAIAHVVAQELASGNVSLSLKSNPIAAQLTQAGHEGEAVIHAVNSMFHEV
jgi:processive 1,2-diacylglycerol beta-glucosyltransferase